MTYVEKGQLVNRDDAAPAQEPERGDATHTVLDILAWPLRAWQHRGELEVFEGLSAEQLRDIGLTPADVVAARCAPFHVGASIVLRELAEQRRCAVLQVSDSEAVDKVHHAPTQQENGK